MKAIVLGGSQSEFNEVEDETMMDLQKQLSTMRGGAVDRARIALQRGDLIAGRKALQDAKSLSQRLIEISSSPLERARREADHEAFAQRIDLDLAAIDRFESRGQSDDAFSPQQLDEDQASREATIQGMRYRSETRLGDIVGAESLKRTLTLIGAMRASSDPAFQGVRGGLLLYGPPGTGKSLIASALSNTFDTPFYHCDLGSLLSKWFGESSKTIGHLFHVARREQATIFIDEIDSIGMGRDLSSGPANRQVLCSLLSEMDGLNSQSGLAPLVIAATNAPWDLDAAVLSRFTRSVYMPLPTAQERAEMIDRQLERVRHEVRIEQVAERANHFSGRELRQLAEIAIEKGTWRTNEKLLRNAEGSLSGIRLVPPHVNDGDFEDAFAMVRPVADDTLVRRYESWSN